MMNESVVEILFYLLDGLFSDESIEECDLNEMVEDLNNAGFSKEGVDKAVDWFYELATIRDSLQPSHQSQSIRIYGQHERMIINTAGQDFLSELQRQGVIDTMLREKIIERALALVEPLDIDALRWIAMMVIMNAGVEMTDKQMAWFLPELNPVIQ